MKRERRYLVFKLKDIDKYLSEDDVDLLDNMAFSIQLGRERDNKLPLITACIESDWPEYETVWNMIEKRVDNS